MSDSPEKQKYLSTTKIGITSQGLPDDVFNVWNDLHNSIQLLELCIQMDGENAALSTDYQTAMDELNTPRQTYEEYADVKFSQEFRGKIQDLLDPSSIDSFNNLVQEFNALAADKFVTAEIAQDFIRRASAIVRGNLIDTNS